MTRRLYRGELFSNEVTTRRSVLYLPQDQLEPLIDKIIEIDMAPVAVRRFQRRY